ncbi:MAG: cytochrome c oxidase subunit II [Chitinivibrionales bacterium]|nr:cytochrome c oxidase subunit II [Chitinivibrionales bacterium]
MATSTAVVNGAFIYILAFAALLFFLIVFFMAFYLVRYRRARNPVPEELPENALIEVIWVAAPTVLALTMFLYGLTGFKFLRHAPPDSYIVKVHSRQWSWLFEYPNGKKSPDMIVPLGKNIKCELTSSDVIHGFYVPAFHIQQNSMPGIKTFVWFNASALGSNYILCSQYCGLKHSMMLAKLIVVPPDQFEIWLKGGKIAFADNPLAVNMPPGETLLFERGCVSCHSVEGATMVGPTFKGLFGSHVRVSTAGKLRTITADEDYIKRSIVDPGADIVDGFPNTMPSARDVLSDEEIGKITDYLKALR